MLINRNLSRHQNSSQNSTQTNHESLDSFIEVQQRHVPADTNSSIPQGTDISIHKLSQRRRKLSNSTTQTQY